jgi:hypothetical protein
LGTRRWLYLAVIMGLTGCAAWSAQWEAPRRGPGAVPADIRLGLRLAVVGRRATMLMLYGGGRQEVFLGCLSCEADLPESIFNPQSPYGSVDHPDSIWNPRGAYGDCESPYSPWNPLADSPPVLKDERGRTHGRFTANARLPGRETDPVILRFLMLQGERQRPDSRP